MLEIVAILICLGINAILAAAETAFIAVSRPSIKERAKKGEREALLLLYLQENPERTLSVIQLGITFVGVLAAALGGAGAEEVITPWLLAHFKISETVAELISIFLVVVPLTYISVVIGELVPKTFALRRPLFLAFKAAPWMYAVGRFLDPIVTAFEWSTKQILKLFPPSHIISEETAEPSSSTNIEILSPKNRQYVINILKIESTLVESIMIPWEDVVYVKEGDSIEEIESLIISSGHTRLPVIKDNEVIGMMNTKEFLAFEKTGQIKWMSIVRPALKIVHTTLILSALQLMQEKRAHMAILYKGTAKIGIVTMESIFEEIIGDIYDEDDDGKLKNILKSIRFKKH